VKNIVNRSYRSYRKNGESGEGRERLPAGKKYIAEEWWVRGVRYLSWKRKSFAFARKDSEE